MTSVARSPQPASGRLRRLAKRFDPLEMTLPQNAVQHLYSLPLWLVVRSERFMAPDRFEGSRLIGERADALVRECEQMIASRPLVTMQDADPTQRRLNRDEGWKTLVLRVYGRDMPESQALMPEARRLLQDCPDICTALISLLEPGKRIFPHPGPMKGILRVHLGVQVPREGRCEIVVAGERRGWRRGEVLVLDDTYLHWVVNDTSERRVVMFFDLVRPMPWPWLDAWNRRVIAWLGSRRRVDVIAERVAARDRDVASSPTPPGVPEPVPERTAPRG